MTTDSPLGRVTLELKIGEVDLNKLKSATNMVGCPGIRDPRIKRN